MQLTKNTDKMFCLIYEEYLNRRKIGLSKSEAISFKNPSILQEQFLQGILEDDIHDAICELSRSKLVKAYIDHGFMLTDNGLIYMENRFKNGLTEVIDFISKLIP